MHSGFNLAKTSLSLKKKKTKTEISRIFLVPVRKGLNETTY